MWLGWEAQQVLASNFLYTQQKHVLGKVIYHDISILQLVEQAIKCTILTFYRSSFHKELKGRLNLFSLVLKWPHCSLKQLVSLVNFKRLIYEVL